MQLNPLEKRYLLFRFVEKEAPQPLSQPTRCCSPPCPSLSFRGQVQHARSSPPREHCERLLLLPPMFKGKKIKKPGDLVKATRTILLTMDKKGTDHKDHEKVTPLFFFLVSHSSLRFRFRCCCLSPVSSPQRLSVAKRCFVIFFLDTFPLLPLGSSFLLCLVLFISVVACYSFSLLQSLLSFIFGTNVFSLLSVEGRAVPIHLEHQNCPLWRWRA